MYCMMMWEICASMVGMLSWTISSSSCRPVSGLPSRS